MPKRISETELAAIKQAVRGFNTGVSIDDIRRVLEFQMPRRTLQRRLALLVKRNDLVLEGDGRGSRYKVKPPLTKIAVGKAYQQDTASAVGTVKVAQIGATYEPDKALANLAEAYIPVSEQGEEVRNSVGLPIHLREPAGYNLGFLETYQPNQTYYLPEKTRRHLLQIGKSQQEVLPAGTYALQIYSRLLIDLTWNSSRLEGNTYSLLETERLIELGESAEGKQAFETQMILNHKKAIELLVESAADVGFNHYTICNLHALLSENLLPDPAACGRLREYSVGVSGSVFHPLQGGSLIREYFDKLLSKANTIDDPVEQAFFAMVHLPYLQPFDDVNKRVSRLAANIPLIRENLSPLSFIDVPEKAYIDGLLGVYELNRAELLADVFVWAYERSCARYSAVRQSLGEPDPFRLRYRESIAQLVTDIVNGAMQKGAAVSHIRQYAEQEIVEPDRRRFIEMVETELMSLHKGNVARYRLRPSEFESWKKSW